MTDPADLSALAARERLISGALSASELTRACLRRIAAREPEVQAWSCVDEKLALARAESLDRYRQTGNPVGPLHGLPVGIKDIIDTEELPTENGNRLDAGRRPTTDALLVARLRAAGAVIPG
ncbi:MAG: amidase, partial [Gammaproteobacteria bacterium]|nr:amidase [Gammaproteobacteria bacterium]